MGSEWPCRVHGVGLGHTPSRVRYNSAVVSTSRDQPYLVSQFNQLEAEIVQMQTLRQDEMSQMRMENQTEMVEMRKIAEVLMRGGNVPNILSTTFGLHVFPR